MGRRIPLSPRESTRGSGLKGRISQKAPQASGGRQCHSRSKNSRAEKKEAAIPLSGLCPPAHMGPDGTQKWGIGGLGPFWLLCFALEASETVFRF